MFKKRVLKAFFVFLSITSAHATNGPRFGIHAGYKHTSVRHFGDFTPSAALVTLGYSVENRQVTSEKGAFSGGLHFGYDWLSTNNWYKSLECSVQIESGTNSKGIVFVNQPFLNQKTITISQKITHDYAISAHLGKAVTRYDVIYLIANLRLARFKESVTASGLPALQMNLPSIQKYRFGAGGGIGYRHIVSGKHSIGVEGTYTLYQKTNIKDDLLSIPGSLLSGDLHVGSKSPDVFRLLFKYSYSF